MNVIGFEFTSYLDYSLLFVKLIQTDQDLDSISIHFLLRVRIMRKQYGCFDSWDWGRPELISNPEAKRKDEHRAGAMAQWIRKDERHHHDKQQTGVTCLSIHRAEEQHLM